MVIFFCLNGIASAANTLNNTICPPPHLLPHDRKARMLEESQTNLISERSSCRKPTVPLFVQVFHIQDKVPKEQPDLPKALQNEVRN